MAVDLALRLGIRNRDGPLGRKGGDGRTRWRFGRAETHDILGLKTLADQSAMAAAIGRQFDMLVPAATLAAMSALADLKRDRRRRADPLLLPAGLPDGRGARPGEQRRPPSLVADVLHHYDMPTPTVPVFAEALESTAIVDAGVFTDAEAISYLQRVAGFLMAAIKAEPDIIRRNGLRCPRCCS